MAKPFYSMEEVCERLGKSEAEVSAMVRDGTLREFRDAGKVFFKAEDIDKLVPGGGESGSDTGEVVLEAADDDELPTLADSTGGTSMIGLEPLEDEPKPPSKEDTAVTTSGIGVFSEDELEVDADPMAKTQITESTTDDQVQLDSGGSGSGLLDLTREADDTALGAAELLDEIWSGEEDQPPQGQAVAEAPAQEEEPVEEAPAEDVSAGEPVRPPAPPAGDPTEGVMGGLLVAALILLALAGSIAASALQQFLPGYATLLTGNFLYFALGAVGLVLIAVGLGFVVGRATGGR